MRSSGERTHVYIYIYIYIVTARPLSPQEGARSRSPQLGELWGERERSRRQYSSQVSVFKPALFTEHSNADKKKRRTVANSVANVGESVAYLGVNMDVACQEGRVPRQ